MGKEQQFSWTGERARPLRVEYPCECGCSQPPSPEYVAYLTGSTTAGEGFSIWLTPEVTAAVQQKLRRARRAS